MKLLTIPEFLSNKIHDGLVIFGSGYSINWIPEEEWDVIKHDYDTWGMNWFCKKRYPTTWYMIREQCITPKRCEDGHMLSDLYNDMAYLKKSVKVVKDLSYQAGNFQHIRNLDKIEGCGYVFKEIKGGCSIKNFRDDIFDEGIHHGKCSLYDALHFAVAMKYEKIVLCGIDLYDSRHFYLPYDQAVRLTSLEGNTVDTPHLTANNTVKLVLGFAEYWKIPIFVQNKRSLLAPIIPVWDGK